MSCPKYAQLSRTFVRSPESFGRILDMIDEGKLALCESPQLLEQPVQENAPSSRDAWIEAQLSHVLKTCGDLVAEGWDRFDRDYANRSDKDIEAMLEKEIVNDLTRLQMQPCISASYRRFVVIKSEAETDIVWDKDGVSPLLPHHRNVADVRLKV